jgi:hypothetical protein
MSTAKRRIEEELRLEAIIAESEEDQQNAADLEREKKEQDDEDDSIAASEDAEIEASIDSAVEDEMIEKIELATAYELRRRRVEQLQRFVDRRNKKAENMQAQALLVQELLDKAASNLAGIKARIDEHMWGEGEMHEFYAEAKIVADRVEIASSSFPIDKRVSRFDKAFNSSRFHKG